MPWFIPHVPERVCKYLVTRYLGQFIEEKLTLNQLSVDFFNGTGTIENVRLDVQALNELGEKQNWPFEFVDGYLDKLSLYVPWTTLLNDSSIVEVHGLKLTLQPKQRNDPATSVFESMWSSMTNSMQLAQECLNQENASVADSVNPVEGIEKFAQLIDSVLSRVKVNFFKTVIQVEHVPQDSLTGVGIKIEIERMNYSDEAGEDPPTGQAPATSYEQSKAYVVSSSTMKNFVLEGVTFSSVEFPSRARTFARSVMVDSSDGKETSSGDGLEEERHFVMFGKLCSKQEIRVILKQSENISGPKVSIEVTLMPLLLFLSPRQVHVLLELANGFASPDNEDTSNVARRQRCVEKPMGPLDYQRIEQQLQEQLHPAFASQPLGINFKGWSAALEESDDEIFLPMKNASGAMVDSSMSGYSSSMDSSFVSNTTASGLSDQQSSYTRKRLKNIESDPTAEIIHFQIRLASLGAVLLHEDILSLSSDSKETLVYSSVEQMRNTADIFFKNVDSYSIMSRKDFEESKKNFDKACQLNHIRILADRVQVEGDETTTSTAFAITGKVLVSKMQLLECLNSDKDRIEHVTLLSFADSAYDTMQGLNTANSCVNMSFKHVEKTGKYGANRRSSIPKTDIVITLDTCTAEVDISIIDRITALLNPEPVCVIKKPAETTWSKASTTYSSTTQSDSSVNFKLKSKKLTLKLRFPIPDFRPAHDMNRVPWWKRNVRPDYLALTFENVVAESGKPVAGAKFYTFVFSAMNGDYFENEKCVGERIVSVEDPTAGKEISKITLQINPMNEDEDDELPPEPEQDIMTQSCYGAFSTHTNKPNGPFSSKRVVHESDTPHGKRQEEAEELILPGDKDEINNFIQESADSCQISVAIDILQIKLTLTTKHTYEVIYNRINNDLLLWEPSAPKPKAAASSQFSKPGNLEIPETFAMCKSGIQFESDSDSEDDTDQESSTVFYSTYEQKARQKQQTFATKRSKQSYLVINVDIRDGSVILKPPVRDPALNVIPEQNAEIFVKTKAVKLCIINGYEGDEDIGYVCVLVDSATMDHCEMVSAHMTPIPNTRGGLMHTLLPSLPGVLSNAKNTGGNRPMVSVAVRIQSSHETHHVKTARVAVGINKTTLNHRLCNEPNNWVSQIMDFFNVKDYPISGYLAKDVLTELHLHLWDCAVDYRPLYLPYRAAVTMGNFSMSFHISAQANTTTLRCIAEDCALFISDKSPSKRQGVPSTASLNLQRDYVNVLDFGLFELSVRTNDKKSGINPHVDLRASNDVVHIRTCSDSARALAQLLTYYASDGDLNPKESEDSSSSKYSSPSHRPEEQLVNVESEECCNLSKSQHEQVAVLLGEAMRESSDEEETPSLSNADPKIFFFPDENYFALNSTKPLPQVTSELGEVICFYNKSSDLEDEFVMLGEDSSSDILPKGSVPEIKWLSEDPLRVSENYFLIPIGKTDTLRAPKNFPMPVMRYTLCEMSVIWHLYGGSDFKPLDKQVEKKKVQFLSESGVGSAIFYSNSSHASETHFTIGGSKRRAPEIPWQKKGGQNRDHKVLMQLQLNKVKFRHEVYPETTKQASRQVLVISELEVRDRLASSDINKFLYQYTTEARPKQSRAHMVVIKLVHIRPDLKLKSQECSLKISLLPLRLNIDQDALLFLIRFFSEFSGNAAPEEGLGTSSSKHSTPTHHPPIMTVSYTESEEEVTEKAQKMVDENLLLLLEENKSGEREEDSASSNTTMKEDAPIYFRSVVFAPDLHITLDYHGKRVDMTHGPLPGLLMGLAQLKCSELCLKRITNKHGLLGVDKLFACLMQEWVTDIKRNQLPNLLGGVGPMHSVVQLFTGFRDLFRMPIEQYQKDGRIVRGLQRGVNSFTTSTAMAALELTSRIIHLIQMTAETAYDMLSPGPSLRRIAKSKGRKKRYAQPQDIREGMANAYMLVKEGFGETADNIVRVASHEHEQKGYSGAVGGVLRQIPPTLFKPIIIASEATNNVLGGVCSQLVPDARREANQKWRSDDS